MEVKLTSEASPRVPPLLSSASEAASRINRDRLNYSLSLGAIQ